MKEQLPKCARSEQRVGPGGRLGSLAGHSLLAVCLGLNVWNVFGWVKLGQKLLPEGKLALETTTASPGAVGKDTIMGEHFPDFFWSLVTLLL